MKTSNNKRRVSLVGMLLLLSLCFTTGLHAQNVTKVFKNAPLKSVLKEVERQTKMSVVYKVSEVSENQRVNATFNNTPVREVLNKVLGDGLTYDIDGKMITIHRRKAAQQQEQTAIRQGQERVISGNVVDGQNEPLIGVAVRVKGTNIGVATDVDGHYSVKTSVQNPQLVFSFIGFTPQTVSAGNRSQVDVTLQEDSKVLNEVVVTAMGIQRKESSLTYATQQVRADDLTKVQDPNVTNSLEGKVSGITVTQSAGGAGGASKITLRGNRSILGSTSPLIVVDGIPMNNSTRNQLSMGSGSTLGYQGVSEGSDPLSEINPDDIESINVLKGANAAALYGSVAANGVVMITTKKGREGKVDIRYSSNLTIDNPLMTPKIQNTYGANVVTGDDGKVTSIDLNGWGDRIANRSANNLIVQAPLDYTQFGNLSIAEGDRKPVYHDVYLRNYANDDVKDFYRTGVTTNNSISLSGGTEKLRTYFSYSNSHANGMLKNNSYNRNTISMRASYKFFDRLNVEASVNYVTAVTRNRPGGGTVGNPIYHMYMTPRNIDMGYYKNNYVVQDASWNSNLQRQYVNNSTYYRQVVNSETGKVTYEPVTAWDWTTTRVGISGPRQNWPYLVARNNNPYWLMNMNSGKQQDDRIYGYLSGNLLIYDGLAFQARIGIDRSRYVSESKRYATTFLPATMDDYGHYWHSNDNTNDIYTDYLLSYNKTFGDWSVSATAGWVGHVRKSEYKPTDVVATWVDGSQQRLSNTPNIFDVSSGGVGATTLSKTTDWDKGAVFTGQVGWKEKVYLEGSYRRDWYRAYKQFRSLGMDVPDNFGYFSLGGNAIVSSLVKLPSWINYMKYRVSYSQVGNSIPNRIYALSTVNRRVNVSSASSYGTFNNPRDERTNSFETGAEMQFLNGRLSLDVTYYNTTTKNLYMEGTNASGVTIPFNSASVRNQGFELTLGYDWLFGRDLRWRTSYNLSYNDNKILDTVYEENGTEKQIYQDVQGVRVRYKKGGSVGDMYVTDYRRNEDGSLKLNSRGLPSLETDPAKVYTTYAGNMNSKWQMGWSNTLSYKNFSLYFLINGRIGGKVISLTEAALDNMGFSERTANAREMAEKNNLVYTDRYGKSYPAMYTPDGTGRLMPIQAYYEKIGGTPNPAEYIYSGTNFRLRELSLGYTFRDLFGANRNLQLAFIARNLFFLYKDSPTDPDVSLSTQNGLSGFEMFNMPSSRQFGFSLKLNF